MFGTAQDYKNVSGEKDHWSPRIDFGHIKWWFLLDGSSPVTKPVFSWVWLVSPLTIKNLHENHPGFLPVFSPGFLPKLQKLQLSDTEMDGDSTLRTMGSRGPFIVKWSVMTWMMKIWASPFYGENLFKKNQMVIHPIVCQCQDCLSAGLLILFGAEAQVTPSIDHKGYCLKPWNLETFPEENHGLLGPRLRAILTLDQFKVQKSQYLPT